jgi:hypothetical protein
MRLTVKEKQKATRITAARYQKASKQSLSLFPLFVFGIASPQFNQ